MRRFLVEILVFMTLVAVIVVGVAALGGAAVQSTVRPVAARGASEAGCFDTPVTSQTDSGVRGGARLCIVDEGVRPAMRAEELAPDTIYSVWLAYFDRPMACRGVPCGRGDLFGEDPIGVLGRMDGVVASGLRKADFWGDFRDLRLSSGSQVTLLLLSHGPASTGDRRARARQLLTPQLPRLGAPLAGAVADGDVGMEVAQAIFNLP
jgi:hypothetical protein